MSSDRFFYLDRQPVVGISVANTGPLIAPVDRAALVGSGLLSEIDPERGTQRLHRSFLIQGLDDEVSFQAHLESEPNRFKPEFRSQSYETIPYDLISEATIRYIGYTPWMAGRLWDRWQRDPLGEVQWEILRDVGNTASDTAANLWQAWRRGPALTFREYEVHGIHVFVIFLVGYIKRTGPIEFPRPCDETWTNALIECGINKSTQDALGHPDGEYRDILVSGRELITNMMTVRFKTLARLRELSHRREKDYMS